MPKAKQTEHYWKYDVGWTHTDDAKIEVEMIQRGGIWRHQGIDHGLGLFGHYRAFQTILWSEEDHNRWTDLMLENFLKNRTTTVIGPKNSWKTHTASKYALIDYFCFPNETTILISSTDLRGLDLRVWGDIKSLLQSAREKYDWLPGHVLEGKHSISTDDLKDPDDIRDARNGIICIPCISSGGTFVGLGKFVGIKNKRVRLIGDELQFMHASYLDAPSNLDGNPDFKAVFLGNPLDPLDPLGRCAEPIEGWTSIGEPNKTTVWKSRFLNGITINLVGTDSPNFDFPQDQPPHLKPEFRDSFRVLFIA